jgi:hypothetical protein
MKPPRARSLRRSQLLTWPGTLQPTARDYSVPVALYLATAAAFALTRRRGQVLEVAGTCAGVASGIAASIAYLRVIQGRATRLELRADALSVAHSNLPRATLGRTLTRWVDPSYGTTVGSALTLRSDAETWIVGCKGPAPSADPSAAETVSRVHVVLEAANFAALLAELERDSAPRSPEPAAAAGYGVDLVPSPTSAGGFLRGLGPLLATALAAEVIGFLAISVFHLPELALAVLSWVLALTGFGWLIAQSRRPKAARYRLRLQGGSASLVDPRTSRVVSEAPLSEVTVVRGSYVVRSRSGAFRYAALRLRWPDARQITIGATEQRLWPRSPAPPKMRAPGLLIGPGDWDRLLEELGLAP